MNIKVQKLPYFAAILILTIPFNTNADIDILHCKSIKKNTERLQCFDKIKIEEEQRIASGKVDKTPKWEKEPATFIGIKLNEPFANSSIPECPKKETIGSFDNWKRGIKEYQFDKFAWEKSKFLCTDGRWWGKERNHISVYIDGFGLLRDSAVVIHSDNGNVGLIETSFYSSSYKDVMELMQAKYGPPTSTKAEEKQLMSGARISNAIAYWKGEHVTIILQSHDKYDDEYRTGYLGNLSAITSYASEQAGRMKDDTLKKGMDNL